MAYKYRTPQQIIEMSVVQGNILYPPKDLHYRQEFKPLRVICEKAGGVWKAGKLNAFKFTDGAQASLDKVFNPPKKQEPKGDYEQKFLY